jgi:hypothetical protein
MLGKIFKAFSAQIVFFACNCLPKSHEIHHFGAAKGARPESFCQKKGFL